MKNIIFVSILFCLTALSAFGSEFSVSVAVQADNDATGEQVEKYLVEELRGIEGINLNDDGDWNIMVMVTENKTEGALTSYTISAVITSESRCATSTSQSKLISATECAKFENFGVFAGSQTDLKAMCEELIADFNDGSLAPLR